MDRDEGVKFAASPKALRGLSNGSRSARTKFEPNQANGYSGNGIEAEIYARRLYLCRAKPEKMRILILTKLIAEPHTEAEVQPTKFTF